MCKLQSFCIIDADALVAYTSKSKLSLSLDKDDFVVNGYPVDVLKHPIKSSTDGKKKVSSDEDEEQDMDIGVEDVETDIREEAVVQCQTSEGDDPSWTPSNQRTHGNDGAFDEHVVGDSGFMPMRPCNLFADEAGPSSSRQHPSLPADVHQISDSDETSDDDDHLIRHTTLTPPSKRQRLNVVDPSPAESTSPPSTTMDYAVQVQLLELRLAEQERKFAEEKVAQQLLLFQQEKERQECDAALERRRAEHQDQLLEKQRLMMERAMELQQETFMATLMSKIGIMMPPPQPVSAMPSSSASPAQLVAVLSTPEVVQATEVCSIAASPVATHGDVEDYARGSPTQRTASPSTPPAPVIDLDDKLQFSPEVSDQVHSTSVELPALAPSFVVSPHQDSTPEYSPGGSLSTE